MSFWKRLFGIKAHQPEPPPPSLSGVGSAPAAVPARSTSSPARPSVKVPDPSRHVERDDTCGFFVFDYGEMDSFYGKQAFEAIYESLRSSSGGCAFHDGDLFSCETVREIAKQANLVKPSTSRSPLADLSGPFDFGAYFAAMWTDTYRNFGVLHEALVALSLPGYLGYMTLQGRREGEAVVELFVRQLHLPASIALRDGAIIKGTSKYGIGLCSTDEVLVHEVELGKLDDSIVLKDRKPQIIREEQTTEAPRNSGPSTDSGEGDAIEVALKQLETATYSSTRNDEAEAKAQLKRLGQPAIDRLLVVALDDRVESTFRKAVIHFILAELKIERAVQPLFERYMKGKNPRSLSDSDPKGFGLFRTVKDGMESMGYQFN